MNSAGKIRWKCAGKNPEKSRKKYCARNAFTACGIGTRLIKKINLTARSAAFGDVILFSQACSSFDQFRIQKNAGEFCPCTMEVLADAISSVSDAGHHNGQAGKNVPAGDFASFAENILNLRRGF